MARRVARVVVASFVGVLAVGVLVVYLVLFKHSGPAQSKLEFTSLDDTSVTYGIADGRVALVVWKDFPGMG
jgi:hypothetical protein